MTDTDKLFRKLDESPYCERIRKAMGDAAKVAHIYPPIGDLLWLDGNWWIVHQFFPTYRGVRFRIEGNRLRLLPQLKDPRNG